MFLPHIWVFKTKVKCSCLKKQTSKQTKTKNKQNNTRQNKTKTKNKTILLKFVNIVCKVQADSVHQTVIASC